MRRFPSRRTRQTARIPGSGSLSGLLAALLLAWGAGPALAAPALPVQGTPAAGSAAGSQDVPAPAPAPAIVRAIEVEGLHSISREALLRILGQEVGKPLDLDEVDHGIDLVWKTYHARVSVLQRPAQDGVSLLVQVQELPEDLEPRFVGNEDYDRKKILEWAGLYEGQPVFLDEAPRIKKRLESAYKSEGYFFVQVRDVVRAGGVDPKTGETVAPDLIFEIQEGPHVRVKAVKVTGNESLPNRRFLLFFKRGLFKLSRRELHGPWLFGWFAKDFVQEDLDADVLAMRNVYRDLGYLDAVVGVDQLEFSRDRKWVTIHLVVDEGPQYQVGSVSIEAVVPYPDPNDPNNTLYRPDDLAIPEEELKKEIELQPGKPYETAAVNRDHGALLRRFGKEGFISHRSLPSGDRWEWLDPEVVVDADKPVVHVTYRVVQGRRIYVREIRVRGNLHTQDRVIRRLITVDEGQVADPTEIEDSRRRIQGTNYFSDNRDVIEHREPDYYFEDTDDPAWKDLVYVVQEGSVLSFNVSGGVSSNLGAFGSISYSQRNFDISRPPRSPGTLISDIADRRAFSGAGQELQINASPGTRVSYFSIFFHEPDIFGLQRDRIGASFRAFKRFRIFRPYDEERNGGAIELSRQIGADSQVFLGITPETVRVSNLTRGGEPTLGDPLTVPRFLKEQEGKSDLGSIDFGYRLSTLDSRLDPHNGFRLNVDNELQTGLLGSDYRYWKLEVGTDFYDELGDENGLQANDRIHLELDAGVATPFGSTDHVPYTERFFLGGQRRLRGFDFRGVGPNENDAPIGGETYGFASFEYRRPLVTATQPGTYREVETLHWGGFVDVGVLGPNDFQLDSGDIRASAGFLFGLSVPLPISFSIGFPLRKGRGDREQRIGFYIGF